MIDQPLISIIVLTYNQEKTIGRTINSILAQKTEYSFEIIIGEDDSPSDNTRAVCEKYAGQYPHIINLLPKAANKGLLKNYADCLKVSRGKYIAGCAGDDWWHNETKLQKQVYFLENNEEYGLCYGGALWYNQVNNDSFYMTPTQPDNENLLNQLLLGNFITAPTVLYRKSLIDSIDFNEFRTLNFCMEDYPMWLIMSEHTKFHCIEEPLISYTINDNSLSRSDDPQKQLDFENNVLRIKLYYWVKCHSMLSIGRIIDSHYYRLLFSYPKVIANRMMIKSFLCQIRNKSTKVKLMSIVTSVPALYNLMCLYYKKRN